MSDDNTLATKGDLKSLVTKDEMKVFAEEIKRHFDVVVEDIRHDLEGANRDEIETMNDNIKVLQKTVGIA